MSLSVCPIALVAAPLERVWALLDNPASYADWRDAQLDTIVPAGPAHAGQTVYAHAPALGRQWKVTTVVEHVDSIRHNIQLTTSRLDGGAA